MSNNLTGTPLGIDKSRRNFIPKLRHHKALDRGYAVFRGRHVYFGTHGKKGSADYKKMPCSMCGVSGLVDS